MNWMKIFVGGVLLICLTEGRFLEGRYRRALPPPYLSVPNHDQCLAVFQASPSHTERCLPLRPLTTCPVQTWTDLQEVLSEAKGVKKVKARAVQPAYLSVPSFKDCLGSQQKQGESHISWCLPETKLQTCPNESWQKLTEVFDGDKCDDQHTIKTRQSVGVGAPAYLSVPGFQDCLGEHKQPGETFTQKCLPTNKPESCTNESWEKLKVVFEGDQCLTQTRQSRQQHLSGVGAPQYLSVPGFQDCLSEHQRPGETFTQKCFPLTKPAECSNESWEKLKEVFTGDKCLTQTRQSRQQQPFLSGVGAPQYLSVPGFQDCLSEHQRPGETFTQKCFPLTKPADCLDESWKKLNEVFTGDKCLTQTRQSRQQHLSGVGAPQYLSVPGFQDCLSEHQRPGETFTQKCFPLTKPAECSNESWEKLKEVFTGDKCLTQTRQSRQQQPFLSGVGAPQYLSVPGYQDCLSEHQKPGETFTQKCFPLTKPTQCSDESWEKLKEVFTGDKCLTHSIGNRQVPFESGVGAPEYLSVPGFQDCLSEHQLDGETFSKKCLPAEKPDLCLSDSWIKIKDVFHGENCINRISIIKIEDPIVSVGTPEYLSVPNFEKCLGEHQNPGATHTERCLPKTKPSDCPDGSWNDLNRVFKGDICLDQKRQSRELSFSVTPPKYLSVSGHSECLGLYQPSTSHSEKCIPIEKPDSCLDEAWTKLQDVFEGIKCPKKETLVGALPPQYLSVLGHESCLFDYVSTSSHTTKCLPQSQPEDCTDIAWEALQNAFDGIECPLQPNGASNSVLPSYLYVSRFENCLDLHQGSATYTEYCLPQIKPESCLESSWDELLTDFKGIRCPPITIGEASAHPPQITGVSGTPPPYLTVPNHQSCLGVQQSISASHTEKCLPTEKPEACPIQSWQQLQSIFQGNSCGPKQTSSLAPAYLGIEGHENCLGIHQPTQSFSERCLPQFQPVDCSTQAWRKLTQVFDGIRCSTGRNTESNFESNTESVDGHDNCLGYHKIDDEHTVKCLPQDQPSGCEGDTWNQLKLSFDGIGCPKNIEEEVSALPPAYLQVEGHEFCLGTYRASETHTEKCLPREKLGDCDESAWLALPSVFNGIRCPNMRKSSQTIDLPQSHLLDEGYEYCVLEQLATENVMEKCLPDIKPEFCSKSSWDNLQLSFVGSHCRRELNSLPPHYLSVPGHENCLESHSAGSYIEKCLPVAKPNNCSVDAWESLQVHFDGNTCREGRATPVDAEQPAYVTIPGYKECIKNFEVTTNHQDVCIPLSRPESCTEEAFNALQSLAFEAQLPRNGRQGAPSYLSVEGFELCLGEHQASETHTEYCFPARKPAECADSAWAALKTEFKGSTCRTQRDDHVNFPKPSRPANQKVVVQHRPANVEKPLILCNADGDCPSNEEDNICNLFFIAVDDNSGVSWDGVCVPVSCNASGLCPQLGNAATGTVSGKCKPATNACEYDQALTPAS